MKASSKRNQWVYLGLILMLVAFMVFSMLPLVSSFVQGRTASTPNSAIPSTITEKLETIALGYQLVLEREPDNENALRGLLEIRLKQGNLPDAIAPLARLAQLHPQDSDYTILLAQTQEQVKDYQGAIQTYQSLLGNDAKNIKAVKGIVDVLTLQDRSQEAVAFVKSTLAQTKATDQASQNYSTSLQLLLGEIFWGQQRYSEAIAVYDQAIKNAQEDFRPLLAKALALQIQGKTAEAEPLFQQSLTLAPVQYKDQIKVMALNKTR